MTYTISHYKENPNPDSMAKASFTAETAAGFQIRNCTLFKAPDGRTWVGMPSREYMVEGKKKFFQYVGFKDREANDRFAAKIMASLNEFLVSSPDVESQESAPAPF